MSGIYDDKNLISGRPFEPVSFFIGLIIGMIILLLIVWICYASNSFLFTYCSSNAPLCKGADYYNDPGEAIANGANINDILFLNDELKMFYKRVPAISSCVPGPGQTVEILYPQYCSFQINGDSIQGRAPTLNNPVYDVKVNGVEETVDTKNIGSCTPNDGEIATSGIPLLKWDSSN